MFSDENKEMNTEEQIINVHHMLHSKTERCKMYLGNSDVGLEKAESV